MKQKQSIQKRMKVWKLYSYLQEEFISNTVLFQHNIVEFSLKNKIGSKKTTLEILNYFIESQLITEVEIPNSNPGRPKKGYKKYTTKEIDNQLVNLAELAPRFNEWINSYAKNNRLTKSRVILKILEFSYLNYISSTGLENLNFPIIELPDYLEKNEIINR